MGDPFPTNPGVYSEKFPITVVPDKVPPMEHQGVAFKITRRGRVHDEGHRSGSRSQHVVPVSAEAWVVVLSRVIQVRRGQLPVENRMPVHVDGGSCSSC